MTGFWKASRYRAEVRREELSNDLRRLCADYLRGILRGREEEEFYSSGLLSIFVLGCTGVWGAAKPRAVSCCASFFGGMFWCWVIFGWVGGAGGLPH